MSGDKTATVIRFPGARAPRRGIDREALASAVKRVAPLWPLENFVAVNPFLGFTDERFEGADRRLRAACDAPLLMPREFYAQALEDGRIGDEDLRAAITAAEVKGVAPSALREHALTTRTAENPFPTVADVATQLSATDWPTLVTSRISHWAAGYFDAGQASWASPFRELAPLAAWKEEMELDRGSTAHLQHAAEVLANLPDDPAGLCDQVLRQLGVSADQLDFYLHRLLMSIGGWVAHARYRGWQQELDGEDPALVMDLLAIRLAWELILLRALSAAGAELTWRRALGEADKRFAEDRWDTRGRRWDLLLHAAYEHAWERGTTAALRRGVDGSDRAERPALQAVFCIDVRSEVLRRALEAQRPDVETFGFAGFFGLPVEYVPLAGEKGSAHCPVLLKPALSIRESVPASPASMANRLSRRIRLRRQLGRGWRAFKNSAVSCFVFVESCGLAYAPKLISHSLGLSRPAPHPGQRGLPAHLASQLGPMLVAGEEEGEGLALTRQVDFAEAMLRGMSLTDGFARVVVLAGHGASTTNNAHGSGLDCGACGGQTGEASARIAAMILNSAAVRDRLRERGIEIPLDTHFVAALHTTTTDEIDLFDLAALPDTHAEDLSTLRSVFADAGRQARGERGRLLGVADDHKAGGALRRRARDWSEVRPEWGLAGCAGFIAAPREWTRGLDLAGRSFLHSYDYRQDRDFATLELIMTAPMLVASWINLQYYGSTVANDTFGSGDKTLHNVVGASIGVLEGNAGDLRAGLPLQSVHDGARFVHEPMRLNVFLAAPIVAINAVLERHDNVRELVDNGWLKLFAIYDEGKVIARYSGNLNWEPVPEDV